MGVTLVSVVMQMQQGQAMSMIADGTLAYTS